MTNKVFLKALQGELTDRVPFWFMRQAGRYLPEYRELRAEKGGFLAMAFDPDAASEITIQPLRRFGMDAAIIFSDILVIPYALGQHLEFVAGEGPKLDPIQDEDGLSILGDEKFDEMLEPVYEALRLTRSGMDREGFEDTALIGFAGSPWTVATYMVEGGGSKDYMATKCFAYRNPDGFGKLIDILVEYTARYLCKQIDAGAEAVQLFDSWASALDSEQFVRWVVEPNARIVEKIRAVHPHVPIIGFPKGAGQNYLVYAEATGVSTLGLDSAVPVDWAAKVLQSKLPVQGALDPFALFAGGEAMRSAALRLLETLGHAPYVFNLGHGINKDTPIAHVEELVQIIKDFKR